MPQNGIYHQGIEALSNSFKNNHNLKVLDLNDNTVTKVGANHIAAALPHLQKLKILNLGDCLLGTDGATILAKALTEKHDNLEVLLFMVFLKEMVIIFFSNQLVQFP